MNMNGHTKLSLNQPDMAIEKVPDKYKQLVQDQTSYYIELYFTHSESGYQVHRILRYFFETGF